MPFDTTADAVDREAAWLATSGDGLPALLTADGGMWDLIQAYVPGTPTLRKNQIWVTRSPGFSLDGEGFIRTKPTYLFELRLLWAKSSSTGTSEADQRAFDVAIHAVVMRVRGIPPPSTDKSHDGKFLSVAENPSRITVRQVPADQTVKAGAFFAATISYAADDFDFPD